MTNDDGRWTMSYRLLSIVIRLLREAMIIIENYNLQWPALYEQERTKILSAIEDLVAGIEHVGSTSVPGLAAKPIVDIMVGLRGADYLDKCIAPLQAIGYEYLPKYEDMMPFRRLFAK